MRRKLIETDPEMTQKIELVEEIIKTIIRLYSIGLSRPADWSGREKTQLTKDREEEVISQILKGQK